MIRHPGRLHVLYLRGLCLAILLAAGSRAVAQNDSQTAAAAAQQTVARLSYLEGTAQVSSATGAADAVDAVVNMPLWPGQSVQAAAHSAAEIEFTDGSLLRIADNSSSTLMRLQTEAQIALGEGLFYLELRATDDPRFTVLAGETTILPIENASFRVHVVNGQAEIAVMSGAVSVSHQNAYTVDLKTGESLRVDPKDHHRYLLSDGIAQESWDSWNERRSQALLDAAGDQTIARNNYAAGQGYGWSDLDAYGTWYAMPGEGLVWQPDAVDASFDPYGYGSWIYGPAGYTWASAYNWGWVPYHCGEWRFLTGTGWFWIPSVGCRSYGGGWYGGGAGWAGGGGGARGPRGWRPPHPPPPPHQVAGGGIRIHPPTIPVRPVDGPPLSRVASIAGEPHRGHPIQVGSGALQPLAPIAPPRVPQSGSAVGSAFRHDFPVQNGTHRPDFGHTSEGLVARPGRADWHAAPQPSASTAEPPTPGGTVTSPVQRTGQVSGWRGTVQQGPASGVILATPHVPAAANTGVSPRIPAGVPAGITPVTPRSPQQNPPVHTLGGAGATPYQPVPTVHAPPTPPIMRSAPIAPTAPSPRYIAPAPPAPVMHSAPPPGAATPARVGPK